MTATDTPWIIGADPGANGALVLLPPYGDDKPQALRFKNLEPPEIWKRLKSLTASKQIVAYMELLQSFGDVKAERLNNLFKMRENSGILQGLLTAAGCEIIKVQPQVWKREFSLVGVGKTYEERKRAAHNKASDEFGPVTADVADALLIAHYGWRKHYEKLTGGKSTGVPLRAGTGVTRVRLTYPGGLCTECEHVNSECICI